VHTVYGSGTQWINRNLQDGVIALNETVENPTVNADMSMTWGGNHDGLKFYVALLDANGNGYIGENGRGSRLAIYRVDNGVMGQWTELAGSTDGVEGNGRRMTLSVNNGTITLANSLGCSLSVAGETNYTCFVRIAFSGYFTASECVVMDNVQVDGTVVDGPICAEGFGILAGAYVPTSPNATWFHNWFVSDENTWWWPGTSGVVHTVYNSGTHWINRNLRDDILGSEKAINNPMVCADMSMTWGGATDGLKFYVTLLDADGNGYIGETTRDTRLAIYRVDNGLTGTWTELASSSEGVAGNGRRVTLLVNDGTLTLTNSLGGTLSASDTTYTKFTQMAFSGYFTASECVIVDNVKIYGTLVGDYYTGSGLLTRNESLVSGKFGTPYGWLEIDGKSLWEQYRKKENVVGYNNCVEGYNIEGDPTKVKYVNLLQYSYSYDAPGLFIDYNATGPATDPKNKMALFSVIDPDNSNNHDSFNVRMGFMENPSAFVSYKGGDNTVMSMYYGEWNTDGVEQCLILDNISSDKWMVTLCRFTQVSGSSYIAEDGRNQLTATIDGDIDVASTEPLPLSWRMYEIEGSVYFEALIGSATYTFEVNVNDPGNTDSEGYMDGTFAWDTAIPVITIGRSSYGYGGSALMNCTIGILSEEAGTTGDFNNDGKINATDIDLLSAAIKTTNPDSKFDLTGEGLVNSSDMDVLVKDILKTYYGDADLNRSVGVSDLSVLAANYNTASGASWANGDFDGNGAVGVSDLSILAANYNSGSASTISWAEAYAQAFGTMSDDANETTDAYADDSEDTTSSVCSSLGLSLIAGLALMGLMIVKLEE
jgi:hypothetical protein